MLDRTVDALALVAGVLLCGLTVLICAHVFGRMTGLFGLGITTDASEYLIYLITLLAAPWVLREGGHITVDLLVRQLPERARRRVLSVAWLLGAAICAALAWYGVRVVWISYDRGTRVFRSIVFEEWLILLPLPIVFLLLLAIFLRWLARPQDSPSRRAEGL